MKFRIKRTSDWFSEESPCDGAYMIKLSEDGEQKFWAIEINTIEELISLRDKIGDDLILGWTYEDELEDRLRQIEIYDTYRE